MDLTDKYLRGCSPYILYLLYNLDKREITLVCAQSIGTMKLGRKVTFQKVTGFKEIEFEDVTDDQVIDSVIGIGQDGETNYHIHTEKREIHFQTSQEPIIQFQ